MSQMTKLFFIVGPFTELIWWIGSIPLRKLWLPGRLYPFILTNFWAQHLWDCPSMSLCNPWSCCAFSWDSYSDPTEMRGALTFLLHSASSFLLCKCAKNPLGNLLMKLKSESLVCEVCFLWYILLAWARNDWFSGPSLWVLMYVTATIVSVQEKKPPGMSN